MTMREAWGAVLRQLWEPPSEPAVCNEPQGANAWCERDEGMKQEDY